MLEVDSLEGTVAQHRIDQVAAKGSKANTVYKLKKNSTKMNKSLYRYTKDQLNLVKTELREHLYFFGYTNTPG